MPKLQHEGEQKEMEACKTVKFYTLPDKTVYPYLLVNRKKYKTLFSRTFNHAIIDSGVMDFVHANVTEYPRRFLDNWAWKATQLQEIFGSKVSFVIPDYPDDYNPGAMGDNVTKTIENIRRFVEEEPKVNWIPVLQSRYLNKLSFLESCQRVKKEVGEHPFLAIGTVCKCKKHDFIVYCCKTARKHFPHSKLHAFGLTLNVLPKVHDLIDSFDSMAWTFPRTPGHSCKTQKERDEYFQAYIERIEQIVGE